MGAAAYGVLEAGEMNQIICGDCAQVVAGFPSNFIDLTVTSPPYDNLRTYNGYVFNFEAIAQQLWRVTRPGGVVVWVVGDATINGSETGTSFRQALYFMSLGFNLHDTMIYEVAGTGAKGSTLAYWQAFEFMFIFSKYKPNTHNLIKDVSNKNAGATVPGRAGIDGRSKNEPFHLINEFGIRTNIWRYSVGFADNSDKTDHPAPFPEALARDHIISWSNPGDLVLDPMCGSGTTLKMAVEQGRRYIGIDISQEYCNIAQRRVFGAQPPLFVEPPAPHPHQQQARLDV